MQGTFFSVEEFSIYDGPGIRTSVFLKGCPLRCQWCHNPEGQYEAPQIIRSPNGCIHCGACEKEAKIKDNRFIYTENSIKACPHNLLRVCGEVIDSKILCEKLLKNEKILKNGGGVTFSGGEPLMQSQFLFECLSILKGRLHTAIQTSGYCDAATFYQAITLADYFLYDLKLADESLHKIFTGASNEQIINNFSLLAKSGKDFVVRIPMIPGITDTTDNITKIAKILRENQINYVELLPYNTMAGGKYKMLQREYKPAFDEKMPINTRENIFMEYGVKIKVL